MPKNTSSGGRSGGRNFEPRYGANKTSFHDRHAGGRTEGARPGSRDSRDDRGGRSDDRRPSTGYAGKRSSSTGSVVNRNTTGHRAEGQRGYRPDRETPKQRWGATERAGRDDANAGRYSGRPQRDDRGGQRFDRNASSERPRYNDRNASTERPRYNDRSDAPRRDDNRGGQRFDRNASSDRPRFDRNASSDRPRYDRNDRNASSERPRYNDRSDAPRRDDNRGGQRFDRNASSDRPRFDRNASSDRPRYDRNDRNASSERPRYNDRSDAPRRDDNRGGQRFDRNASSERPRYDRNDRNASSERPRYSDRSDAPRRDFNNDRPRRDFNENRPRREEGGRDNWIKSSPTVHAPDVVHERLEAKTVAAVEVAGVSFADLGLGANIVETLAGLGAASPFAIQAASIPAALAGRDVLGRGRTGSGKTIAFGAPLVERVLQSQAGKRREFGRKPRAIILAPTRELALQIDRTIQPIARSVGLFTTQIYGGVPQGRQVGALKKGVDIIIGTPGRIEDLINQGKLDLSDCRVAVLDEADHMCELGFVEPVQRILRHTKEGSQKLLFSATLDREVAALVDEFLVDPAVFEVAGEDQDSSTIEHRVLVIEHRDKGEILTSLVDRPGKTLVFARTRAYADTLAEQFDDAGIAAVSLHGDLNQAKRTRNLERLTSGRVNVLVATDVAARGIHVDDIDLVIQADAPDEYKTYLHRSGRTGRAGRAGRVVTLITRPRARRMTELLDRAEIDAPFEHARLGDEVIEEITGRAMTVADITK